MIYIRDFLISFFGFLGEMIAYFAEKTEEAGVVFDPLILVALTFLLLFFITSGFWAGSIAGSRRRSMVVHFIIGCLIPYVYPFVIMFALDVKGAKELKRKKEEEKRQQEQEELEQQRLAERAGLASTEGDDGAEEEAISFDAAYFKSIARDGNGNPTGPWLISYNGETVVAQSFVEWMPNVLVIEMENGKGEMQRMRIRYELIERCEPV